jgi:hypothetical protein
MIFPFGLLPVLPLSNAGTLHDRYPGMLFSTMLTVVTHMLGDLSYAELTDSMIQKNRKSNECSSTAGVSRESETESEWTRAESDARVSEALGQCQIQIEIFTSLTAVDTPQKEQCSSTAPVACRWRARLTPSYPPSLSDFISNAFNRPWYLGIRDTTFFDFIKVSR